MAHILIASPVFGGNTRIEFATSLMHLTTTLTQRGVPYNFIWLAYSDIAMSRNLLASCALQHPEITHVLMIDADMHYEPAAILRMLEHDMPVIACTAPIKEIDFDRLVALARANPNAPTGKLVAMSQGYNFFREPGGVEVKDGVIDVLHVGMGIGLIQIGVFRSLSRHPAVTKIEKHALRTKYGCGPIFGFFDHITAADGTAHPEDYSFCERVRTLLGLPIKALITENIGHVGTMMYQHPCALKIIGD